MPLVSIILPTFNRLSYLRLAVDSIFAQTFTEWELLIADDGSEPETQTYLRTLQADPRVRVLCFEHSGNPPQVRNMALAHATGQYVAFLDSDDLWEPRKLELQMRSLLERPGLEWSYTGLKIMDEWGEELTASRPATRALSGGRMLERLLKGESLIVQSSVVIRRDALAAVGGYDTTLPVCGDYALFIALARRGEIDFVDLPLVSLRRHEQHYSSDLSGLDDLQRMFEGEYRREPARSLRSLIQERRARAASGLLVGYARSGEPRRALATALTSVPYGWHRLAWWRATRKAVLLALTPDILRILWRLLERGQRRQLIGLQLLSIVMAVSTATGVAAVLPFLTALADPQALQHHPALYSLYAGLSFTDPRAFVVALGIAFAAGVVLANALNLFGSLAIDRFAYSVGNSLNVSLFAEYLHRDYGFHSRTSAALLTNNVLHETGRVTNGILRHGLMMVTSAVTVALIVASVLMFEPLLGGLAFLGLAAAYAGVYAFVRRRLRHNGRMETREYIERTKLVGDSFGAVKEILLSQAQRSLVERFARSCSAIAATVTSTLAVSQSPRYVLEGVMVCALVALGLRASGSGTGTPDPAWVASLSFTALAVYRLLPAIQQVFAALVRIRADRHALESIAEDLTQARARPSTGPIREQQAWRRRPREAIRLKNVSFRYAEDRAAAIDALNLEIPTGALVGLVGPNGSGKTTLVDLICGLLAPQSGCIEIDGIRLTETNRSAWQSTIAYVPQQIFVCDCTLAENIALGVPAAEISRERMHRAVQLARLESYVTALPRGYDEILGGRGSQLSGGQRQQLGIARALYRDASVLVMDEPTSALDQTTEHELVEMLAAGRGDRTTVLVTHRRSTLRYCDVVYELGKGQIVRSRADYLAEGTYAS